jgi:hypothetical protein
MEKMFRQIIYFLLVPLIVGSCSTDKKPGVATISGSAPEIADQWIFLEELEVGRLVMDDSVKTDKQGNFKFEVQLTGPSFYVLMTSKENRMTLLIDQNENIVINCKSKSFDKECFVSGSPGSALLISFEQFMLSQKRKIDSLAQVFYDYESSPDFLKKKLELDSIYSLIMEDQRKYVMNFINKNNESLSSLLVINRKLGNNIVLDEEEDFIYFHRIDSALSLLYPGNKHVMDHHNRVEEIRRRIYARFTADENLQPGKKAPNIVVRDTINQPIALKSLEGKKVLICFWAGWNAKSRQDNRKLVELYPKLKKNNFEVFGVSMDENEIVWKGAIRLDRLPGMQGSDLKGLSSEVMKDYNLADQLPFFYIVDEERKIIYRDRDFDKIILQLKQIF